MIWIRLTGMQTYYIMVCVGYQIIPVLSEGEPPGTFVGPWKSSSELTGKYAYVTSLLEQIAQGIRKKWFVFVVWCCNRELATCHIYRLGISVSPARSGTVAWTTYCQLKHYDDAIMGEIASQITSLDIVYSTVYSGADQSKHQSSASLAFVWGIHRGPVNSPHKWPVTRKMFPFDDVIMECPSVCAIVITLRCPLKINVKLQYVSNSLSCKQK